MKKLSLINMESAEVCRPRPPNATGRGCLEQGSRLSGSPQSVWYMAFPQASFGEDLLRPPVKPLTPLMGPDSCGTILAQETLSRTCGESILFISLDDEL